MYKALLICNSIYEKDPATFPNLYGPAIDGLLLWRQLVDDDTGLFLEGNVTALFEYTHGELAVVIERFFREASKDDTLLLYFSGHGHSVGDELYISVRDTSSRTIRSTAIASSILSQIISESKASAIHVWLDCCYAGNMKGAPLPLGKLGGTGRYVIAATGAASVAPDSGELGVPSPFTAALVDALRELPISQAELGEFVTVDALFTEIDARLSSMGYPEPKRKYDGTGVAPIARSSRNASSSWSTQAPVHPPTEAVHRQPYVTPILSGPRQAADMTASDLRNWVAYVVLCVTGFLALALLKMDGEYWGAVPNVVSGLSAAILLAYMVISVIDGRLLIELKKCSSRREVLQHMSSGWRRTTRRARFGIALIAISTIIFAVLADSPSFTDFWPYILTLSIIAALAMITTFEWVSWGDSTLAAGAACVILGSFVPIAHDHFEESLTYDVGVNGGGGLIRAILGAGMIICWWLRVRRGVAAVPGILVILITLDTPLDTDGYGWILSALGAFIFLLSLKLGAMKPVEVILER